MHRWLQFLVRTSVIAAALVALGWLLGIVFPADEVPDEATGLVGGVLLAFVSSFLLAAPLAYPISRSRLTGKALLGAVFVTVFGLMTVLTQMESALFLDMTASELLIEILRLTIVSGALSWLAVALYPQLDTEPAAVGHKPNPPTTGSWIRRWIGVAFVYMVLYITAGLLILPVIRTWYEAQGALEQNPALIFPLQLVRGALFVAFVLPLLRSMRVTRRQASLAMAVMIPLVHAVAILIPPSPVMPAYVRHAHMIEIGWSNFVLGLLIGYLFWNPRASGNEEAARDEL